MSPFATRLLPPASRPALRPSCARRSGLREGGSSASLRSTSQAGFTVVELAVVAAMVAILTTMIVPLARYSARRQDEIELRYQLRLMRDAIDKYKQYSDLGLIPPQLGTEGYPPDLKTLVDGVTLVGQLDKKQKFLRRIPTDPMTKKAEWGMRSFQDEPDTFAWGGQNVYDVFSLSDARGIDGTYYKDW